MTQAGARRSPGLDQVASLARGLEPVARGIAVASLISAGILGYALHAWLQMAMGWLVTLLIVLALPGLLYAWLWWLMWALADLPGRVHGAIETVKDIRDREPATSAMRKMGRALRDVWNVLDEADNVWLPISATILLMNPIGWMLLVGGLAFAVILWLCAGVAGVALLF
jgi:hypothetical protein